MIHLYLFAVMAGLEDPSAFVSFVLAMLIILVNVEEALLQSLQFITEAPSLMGVPILDDDDGGGGCHVAQLNRLAVAALHYCRVCNNNFQQRPCTWILGEATFHDLVLGSNASSSRSTMMIGDHHSSKWPKTLCFDSQTYCVPTSKRIT